MADFDQERLRELKRQALVLASELVERRTNDPLRKFQPHEKQSAFIDAVLNGERKENWFIAANRAGKSDAGAFLGSRFARFGMPDWDKNKKWVGGKGSRLQIADRATNGWVVSVDFPSSRDVIQPKYFNNGFVPQNSSHPPFIPEHEIDKNGWRSGDQILKMKNGSIVGFKSCDSGPEKFQGAEKDWVHYDERPDYEVYKETGIRISTSPLVIFGTCTNLPEHGSKTGTTWLYDKIIDPWKKGKVNIGIYTASIYDNPYLGKEQIKELEDKYPEGSVERRIRLDGELLPGLLGARVYVAFVHKLHVRPQPPIMTRRPLLWTMDFNVSPMLSHICQREQGLIRVHRELVVDGEGIPGMAEAFINAMPSHQSEVWIYGDATGKKRNVQTGKSDYYVLTNALKQHDMNLRMKVPEENPPVVDRVNALNQALKNSEGVISIEIDPQCVELIADLEQVVWDKKGKIKKVTNPKDPYFRRTHASDDLGYLVSYEMPVRQTSLGQPDGRKRAVNVADPRYNVNR